MPEIRFAGSIPAGCVLKMKYNIKYVHDFTLDVEDDMEGNYKIVYENEDYYSKTIIKIPIKKFEKKILKFLIDLGIHPLTCGY